MLLEQIYGWPQGIGTQDIDFAVQVGDWEHYRLLCEYIARNDVFEAERKPVKRFKSKEDRIFDLVPYGGVENERKQVFWPPDNDNDDVMTVRGFETTAKETRQRQTLSTFGNFLTLVADNMPIVGSLSPALSK